MKQVIRLNNYKTWLAALMMSLLVGLYPVMAVADSPAPAPDQTQSTAPSDAPPASTAPPATTTAPAAPAPAADQTATPAPTADSSQPSSDNRGPRTTPGNTGPVGPQGTVGPQSPTGADATTYHFNPDTGLWENNHYTWNPETKQSAPKDHPDYAYDPKTQTWSTEKWIFNPATGRYDDVSQVVNPLVAQFLGLNPPPGSATASPLAAANAAGNGANSNNYFNLFTNATISNNILAAALSGDAGVGGNTTAGGALTGNASVFSNIINAFNAMWSLAGGNVVSFFQNIFGNVNGDLTINPNALAANGGAGGATNGSINTTGPNSSNTITDKNGVSTTVNNAVSGAINNNVNLAAQSGNAGVNGNTVAGDATSGMASVVLNLVNLLNSAISSGQSFMGMINIFGNFNGDILFPPGFLNSLLSLGNGASPTTTSDAVNNTGPNSSNTISQANNGQTNISNASTNGISNNLATTANSGNANVSHNTTAGSATTGAANSNVTLFNLTGQNVIGDNAFLVCVNVLGHWVGFIMNAPAGVHSALLGGGASISNGGSGSTGTIGTTGPNSNNAIAGSNNSKTNVANSSNNAINNNINLAAQSGDANVTNNTKAGNATTGAANIAANVVNISMSNLALTHWFGVLFVNVFGNWTGALGVNTAAGDPTGGSGNSGGSAAPLSFSPASANHTSGNTNASHVNGSANNGSSTHVTAAGPTAPGGSSGTLTSVSPAKSLKSLAGKPFLKTVQFTLICLAAAAALIGVDQLFTRRRRHLRLHTRNIPPSV